MGLISPNQNNGPIAPVLFCEVAEKCNSGSMMQPKNEPPSTEFVPRKEVNVTDETELRLRRQVDALQKTCEDRAELLVKAHNALIPLAQWERPCNPTAKDCILAGEIKQAIAEMIPMVPKP